MSRKKNGKSIPRSMGPWVPWFKRQFDSPAFEHLSGSAQRAYLIIYSQKSCWNQKEVICPYSYASRKMNAHSFAKGVRELVKAGFIKIKRYGGLYRYTNIYEFSDDWERRY